MDDIFMETFVDSIFQDNLFMVFGPNDTYLYNGPDKWCRWLLTDMENFNFHTTYGFCNAYNAALGPNGSYYIGGTKKFMDESGFFDSCNYSNLPQELSKWIGKAHYKPDRDIKTLKVFLGPSGAFFAQDKAGFIQAGLSKTLSNFFKDTCSPTKHYVKTLALGPSGAFFVLMDDGSFAYDLVGTIPIFDELASQNYDHIRNMETSPRQFFGMSHCDTRRWIAICKDGRVMGEVPDAWISDIQPVTDNIQERLSAPPPAVQGPTISRQAPISTRPMPQPQRTPRQSRGMDSGLLKGAFKFGMAMLNSDTASGGVSFFSTAPTFDYSGRGGGVGTTTFSQPIQSAANDPIQ
ncbi:MAG: hypothetical protein M4579_003959 [Chaenotheca gracillima]|nr:MAG: hypothetical protein M4579_003959 [Chaenotheca gracillima]